MTRSVGMGQIAVACTGFLTINGLGSCVGLAMFDPVNLISGLAHIMLLDSPAVVNPRIQKGKYADTAIPELVEMICGHGAERRHLQAKMAGGAQMFIGSKGADVLPIGERNSIRCKTLLGKLNIPLVAEDLGGNYGRNLLLECQTGRLQIRNATLGLKEI